MLRPEPMLELAMLVRSEDVPRTVEVLADAKAVHLTDHKRQRLAHTEIDIGTPLPSAERISDALVRTRALLAKIPKEAAPSTPRRPHSIEQRILRVQEIAQRYAEHERALAQLEQREKELMERQRLFALLPPDAGLLLESRTLVPLLARRTRRSTRADIPAVLRREHGEHVLLHVRRSDEQHAREALVASRHDLVDISPLRGIDPAQLREELAVVRRQAESERAAMASSRQHREFLAESEEELLLALLKAQAPLHFGATRRATLIRGFIPARRGEEFSAMLQHAGIDAVLDLREAREAPTLLRNPRQVRNFEALLELYTLPKYKELDPTCLMAITFPIFFGFMLGDIGYGLALLAAFLMIRRIPKAQRFSDIVIISAVSTIIFGFIFGEFFGMEHIFGLHLTPLLHRAQDIELMLGIAVLIGIVHVNLGLVLGMANKAHEGWAFAVVEKGSWVTLQAGAILVASAMGWLEGIPVLGSLHAGPQVAWAVLLLSIAGIGISERLQGLLELPMILSHILSYTRLVAIGLASVYLAFVVNGMGASLFAKGGIWIPVAVLVVVVGHAVNLALGLLGPFLHSLRLHYAEFFMKFYEGGGQRYRPFGTVEA